MLHFSPSNLLHAETVRSLIEEALGDLSEVEVAAYEPVPRPLR